jgi:splicing suppressor protein 51
MSIARPIISLRAYARLPAINVGRSWLLYTGVTGGKNRAVPFVHTRRNLSIASLLGGKKAQNKPSSAIQPTLQPDNLFHPLSLSPFRDLQEQGKAAADHGVCPSCLTEAGIPKATGLEAHNASKKPSFTCPDCGFPTHCSREHWELDREAHQKVCKELRQVNEDEHDLRSGRRLLEFEYPGPQGFEEAINLSNWDTFFYTRNFPSLNEERFLRHASKPLTYPITIASMLHDTSPYTVANDLTSEGIKSLTGRNSV